MRDELVKLLADVEHKMDTGEIKHVKLDGKRVPLTDDIQKKFGLVDGQSINDIILAAMVHEVEREFMLAAGFTAEKSVSTQPNNVMPKGCVDTASATILNFGDKKV